MLNPLGVINKKNREVNMSVEGIQSDESIAIEPVLDVEKESKKVGMDISSFARPNGRLQRMADTSIRIIS